MMMMMMMNSDGTVWNIEPPPAYIAQTYIFTWIGVITTESIANYLRLIHNNMPNTFIGLEKSYGSLYGFMVDETILCHAFQQIFH